MTNKSIIVIGMHRSGTSALSGELDRLGVFMGKSLFKAQKGVNDKGFFENRRLVEINEAIQDAIGSSWDDPLGLLKQESDPGDQIYEWAKAFIQDEYIGSKLWGMKDPRVSVLLPFWQRVFAAHHIQPHYILMIRHPFEVAASISKRDGYSQDKGLMLWLNHNFASFIKTTEQSRIIVNFADLIDNPKAFRQQLCVELNSALDDDESNSFIDAALQRHVIDVNVTADDTADLTALQTLALKLFAAICNNDAAEVDTLHHRYLAYLSSLDKVLIEHLSMVQQSETHFRTVFERAYDSYSWKLMSPLRKLEQLFRVKRL